jgi:hypothetical protein
MFISQIGKILEAEAQSMERDLLGDDPPVLGVSTTRLFLRLRRILHCKTNYEGTSRSMARKTGC